MVKRKTLQNPIDLYDNNEHEIDKAISTNNKSTTHYKIEDLNRYTKKIDSF